MTDLVPLRSRFMLLACLMLGLVATCVSHAQERTALTVFAAASLKESMDEAAATYARDAGVPVRVSYAASSALARQIEHGAPADAFFSADLEWMDYLQARNRVDATQRHNLLGNRLVLITRKDNPVRIDLAGPNSILAALGARGRLAVGQTASVPAGKYTRASLQNLGQWDSVKTRLAESESVRAALMLVARGEAPLGVVYASDAKAEPSVRIVATFPDNSHPDIIYPIAALRGAHEAQAAAFMRWLTSPKGRAIFERHGFRPLR